MPQALQEPDKPGPPERNNSGPGSANKIFWGLTYKGKNIYTVKFNLSDSWNSKINFLFSSKHSKIISL